MTEVTSSDDAALQRSDPTSGTTGRALATGGSLLAAAMFVSNAGNYLLNVVLGRWLTPPEFADANLMVTLMLLVTAIAVSLQLIGARFASQNEVSGTADDTRSLARGLTRWAAAVGVLLALVLVAGAPVWRDLFNSASAWPFVILGLGMPAYLLQAVGRGVLQGRLEFAGLARTFIHEMLVRVTLGVALVALGLGVTGATVALSLSFVATWFSVRLTLGWKPSDVAPSIPAEVRTYAWPVAVLLLGQIIINNGDVLISKQGLDPTNAGVYAAIALVGRAVFFLSWSVATTIFPAAAQRHEAGDDAEKLLGAGLIAVAVLGAAAVIGARLLGGTVLGRVFGPEYADVSSPLARYALATAIFAMANLIVSHDLALGRLREAVVMLAGAGVQTVLLLVAPRTIDGLIGAQIVAMSVLFGAVALSHLARHWSPSLQLEPAR